MNKTLCAVVVAAIGVGMAACAGGGDGGGGGGGGVDASTHNTTPECGDGVCAASELDTCPQDCGSGSGTVHLDAGTGAQSTCNNNFTCEPNLGETADNCPNDCGAGSGSGSGSGSGTLDCSDPTVLEECFECILASDCEGGVTEDSCESCASQL
jgi:hypothetical protein